MRKTLLTTQEAESIHKAMIRLLATNPNLILRFLSNSYTDKLAGRQDRVDSGIVSRPRHRRAGGAWLPLFCQDVIGSSVLKAFCHSELQFALLLLHLVTLPII